MVRVPAFSDALDEWYQGDGFNGCTFTNASVEYPRREDPIHMVCARYKKLVVQFVEELLDSYLSSP